jgi:hypothetical protein
MPEKTYVENHNKVSKTFMQIAAANLSSTVNPLAKILQYCELTHPSYATL